MHFHEMLPFFPNQYYQTEKSINLHHSVIFGLDFICSISTHASPPSLSPSLFINWTLSIGFQECLPNSAFTKYRKKGSRLVKAGTAPAMSMGLSWGTGPLWVLTEAFYVLQRCRIMQRSQETTLCLQFAKIRDTLAVTSHLRLTAAQWQLWIRTM